MDAAELIGVILGLLVIGLCVYICLVWLNFPFDVRKRLHRLIEIGEHLERMGGGIPTPPERQEEHRIPTTPAPVVSRISVRLNRIGCPNSSESATSVHPEGGESTPSSGPQAAVPALLAGPGVSGQVDAPRP